MTAISVVIPVYNEKDSLETLHAEITATAQIYQLDLEIIFVDDGSRDGSWDVIRTLADRDAGARGIRFRRNFGKAAALSAGFRVARGDIILTLDADLQDDPAEIPRFLEMMRNGKDVVSGWKKRRLDPWHKVMPSRVFNWLVSRITGVKLHDHNCGMKSYRTEVFREVRLYGEMHRFIPVLAHARGFTVGEIVINHRPRQHGHSKYGIRRFLRGFLDLITVKFLTGFNRRPQHLLGGLGLFFFFVGAVCLAYLAGVWVVRLWDKSLEPLHERALLLYAVAALLLGAQLFSLGLIAELMTDHLTRDEDTYSIAEQTPASGGRKPPDGSPDQGIHAQGIKPPDGSPDQGIKLPDSSPDQGAYAPRSPSPVERKEPT